MLEPTSVGLVLVLEHTQNSVVSDVPLNHPINGKLHVDKALMAKEPRSVDELVESNNEESKEV